MKVSIGQRKGDGSVVYTSIEPFGRSDSKIHSVSVERRDPAEGRLLARFFLDNEEEVGEFICLIFIFNPAAYQLLKSKNVFDAWHENNLEELYA